MRAPDRLARTVLVVSLVLATSTPLVWELTTPPANAGTLPAEVAAAPAATTAVRGGQAGVDTDGARRAGAAADAAQLAQTRAEADATQQAGTGGEVDEVRPAGAGAAPAAGDRGREVAAADGPRVATRSARISDLEVARTQAPTRLRIPSIDVNARIGAIGVEADGELEVPENVRNVGWYRFGPAPGEPGATVIAGHVDSRAQGPGAFFDLRSLAVGARVSVTDGNGDVQRFEVVARRRYDKAKLPVEDLFSREGPSQLVLITCGGDFDGDARSYRENVVVYAQPVST